METSLVKTPVQQSSAVSQIVNFFDPVQFETVQRTSKFFASSKLVPSMYQIGGKVKKGKDAEPVPAAEAIANCMIAIDIAARIGASPLMVMQNLAIIEGRPSWSSKFLIATVNSCGRFEPLKFKFVDKGRLGKVPFVDYIWNGSYKVAQNREFDGTKMQDIECIAYTTKKGSDEILESSPISLRMAVEEGWYTKNGSKWRTMPKQMLMYRAASFWTSAYAPELSMGMHTIEEAHDIQDADAEEIIEDVTEQVEQEKSESANKEVIDFSGEDDQSPQQPDNEAPEGVDPETGEIKEQTQKEQPRQNEAPEY